MVLILCNCCNKRLKRLRTCPDCGKPACRSCFMDGKCKDCYLKARAQDIDYTKGQRYETWNAGI